MGDRPSSRRLAVGASEQRDPAVAGAEAARAASVTEPKLALLFASAARDPIHVLEGIASELGEVPVIGCTAAGELSSAGASDDAVVVAVLGGPGIEAATAHTESLTPATEAAAALATALDGVNGKPNKAMIVLADGLEPGRQDLITGLYAETGAALPIVGGCAGDDPGVDRTLQFHGSEIFSGGAVAAVIASDGPIGVGIEHGHSVVAGPSVVTSASGTRILELDGVPAADAYLAANDAPALVHDDPGVRRAFTHSRPIAVSPPRGRPHLRFVADADPATGALLCGAEVERGTLVWFTHGDAESAAGAAGLALESAGSSLGSDPIGFLCFDCVARQGMLGGQGIEQTVRTISGNGGEIPLAGFLGYAQIGRLRGMSGLHNQTLVVLGLG